jgi:hypothetical protein
MFKGCELCRYLKPIMHVSVLHGHVWDRLDPRPPVIQVALDLGRIRTLFAALPACLSNGQRETCHNLQAHVESARLDYATAIDFNVVKRP